MQLAASLGQHVFDTLYHALALEAPGAVLVTADERYLASAAERGGVLRLAQWTLPTAGT